MAARNCQATNAEGRPCGRAPSRGKDLCAAHDPDYRAQHAEAVKAGGRARWSSSLLDYKAEVRELMRRVDEGDVDPTRAKLLFAGFRILRELEADARHAAALDELESKIAALYEAVDAA